MHTTANIGRLSESYTSASTSWHFENASRFLLFCRASLSLLILIIGDDFYSLRYFILVMLKSSQQRGEVIPPISTIVSTRLICLKYKYLIIFSPCFSISLYFILIYHADYIHSIFDDFPSNKIIAAALSLLAYNA